MAGNRTLGIKALQAWPAGSREKSRTYFEMADIEQLNLLDLFGEMNDGVAAAPLRFAEKKLSIRVVEQVRSGAAHLTTYSRGAYGDPGRTVINEVTGEETHPLSEDESLPTRLRCALVVPRGMTTALLFTEQDGSDSVSTAVSELLKQTFRNEKLQTKVPGRKKGEFVDKDITLDVSTYQEPEAWKKGAAYLRFRVIRQQKPADFLPSSSSGGAPATMSESELYLPAGGNSFADHVSQFLTGKAADAAARLHIPDPESIEDIEVTLKKDDRQKTFMLSTERMPSWRRVMTTTGMAPLPTRRFMAMVKEETEQYFSAGGVRLADDWLDLEDFKNG